MRTSEQNQAGEAEDVVPIEVDPEEIWLDQDVSPEELIRLDPMQITEEIIEMAEHPELADPVIAEIPVRNRGRRCEADD